MSRKSKRYGNLVRFQLFSCCRNLRKLLQTFWSRQFWTIEPKTGVLAWCIVYSPSPLQKCSSRNRFGYLQIHYLLRLHCKRCLVVRLFTRGKRKDDNALSQVILKIDAERSQFLRSDNCADSSPEFAFGVKLLEFFQVETQILRDEVIVANRHPFSFNYFGSSISLIWVNREQWRNQVLGILWDLSPVFFGGKQS